MEGLTTAARLPSDVPRDLYPFEGRFFDRDGLAYHYLDEGEGPAVVMVHGNPTWSFYYRQLVQALSPTHRCLVPDHIGCGLSDKPSADAYPYTLEARADDLEAWSMLTAADPEHLGAGVEVADLGAGCANRLGEPSSAGWDI